jgi:undecaprenyl-diphosphatase
MGNFLTGIDTGLFIFINHLPHNQIFNGLFLSLSGIGSFGIVWFIIGLVVIWEEEVRDKKGLVALILSSVVSIISSGYLLKDLFARPRPDIVLQGVLNIGGIVNSFSFPSEHSTLAFSGAFVLSHFHPNYRPWFYLLATLIAFSRIYLGKHFPSDVLGGAIIGTLIGYLSVFLVKRFFCKIIQKKK